MLVRCQRASWNRTVFNFFLDASLDDSCLRHFGRLFHSRAAEYLKDRAAKVSCLILCVTRLGPLLLDHMLDCLFSLSGIRS